MILKLSEYGNPPVDHDEVYKEIFEQQKTATNAGLLDTVFTTMTGTYSVSASEVDENLFRLSGFVR